MSLRRRSGRRCSIDDVRVQPLDVLCELLVKLTLIDHVHADGVVHVAGVCFKGIRELRQPLSMLVSSAVQSCELALQRVDVMAMSMACVSSTTIPGSEWARAAATV